MNDMKEQLSLLWIFVLFNMVFADVIGFLNPGDLEKIMKGDIGIELTQPLMLLISVFQEIPIAMVVLSRFLNYKVNRWANIIAAMITIVYVVGGMDTYVSYLFFMTIEVACLLYIAWLAFKWEEPEASLS